MMIRKLGRGVAVAVATAALAVGGSAAFAGTAFASDHDCCSHGHNAHHGIDGDHNDYYRENGGDGGNGGKANANCVVPLGVSAGVMGQGGNNSQCNSTSGNGGGGGDGGE
ncbi:MAG TPA: hypothetical protein VH141_03385 [Pseudonocardia sp.]|jgi:hypothetical protein|nr:hypothetical protein [Pseudonocardia sp.]